jgi:hypothetical protein
MEGVQEVVWCDHLAGQTIPLVGGRSVLLCHFRRSFYAVVEERKLKMLCEPCFHLATTVLGQSAN